MLLMRWSGLAAPVLEGPLDGPYREEFWGYLGDDQSNVLN